jgi:DNA ligase (NAD+)
MKKSSNLTNDEFADLLEQVIPILDTLYEDAQDCILPNEIGEEIGFDANHVVTDPQYDELRRLLKKCRPKSSVFDAATASTLDSGVQKVKHDPPLSSIEKASHEILDKKEEMLFKWLSDCQTSHLAKEGHVLEGKKYKGQEVSYPKDAFFCQSYKLDGVALALYYEDGELVKAGLRPRDGINGEDVTEQVKYVKSIPQKLKEPVTCSIRGELICKLSDFEKVQAELKKTNEQLRANPRNHAAGGIRHFKEPEKVEKMRLSFIGYAIEGLDNPTYDTEIERAKYANRKLGIRFVQVQPFNFYDLKKMEDNVQELDYEVDGVVISVNNFKDQEQLGRHGNKPTGNPRGKIAWKFAEERQQPTIKSIEWNTGRTGAVKPVAVFDSVRLAGTNVSRATLHNYGFMMRGNIDVGTKIEVLKAGKIIPKVVGVVDGQCILPKYPKVCPSCYSDTLVQHTPGRGKQGDTYELICPNKDNCPAQNVNRLCHFLTTIGALGLGESRISLLTEGGKVKTFADFYKLTVVDCVKCGLSKRQGLLALGTIFMIPSADQMEDDKLEKAIENVRKKKLKIPLWQIFAAFGITGAGKTAGKALAEHFKSLKAIIEACSEDMEEVEGVGTKSAEAIQDYMGDNRDIVEELLEFIEPELPKMGKLSGKVFCFSGGFAEGKKSWETKVEDLGGKCTGSVGSKVHYLIAGDGSGAKSQKAKDLGVPILDIDDLEKML